MNCRYCSKLLHFDMVDLHMSHPLKTSEKDQNSWMKEKGYTRGGIHWCDCCLWIITCLTSVWCGANTDKTTAVSIACTTIIAWIWCTSITTFEIQNSVHCITKCKETRFTRSSGCKGCACSSWILHGTCWTAICVSAVAEETITSIVTCCTILTWIYRTIFKCYEIDHANDCKNNPSNQRKPYVLRLLLRTLL